MNKTFLFLSITFFLRLSMFAQEYEHLQPFTDYGNCGHGLKTPSGKIILEPFYDRIDFFHQREDRKSGYWIVTQSEKVGIINEKGQWLFPLEYDRIRMTYDRRNFICTKDTTTNIYDKDFQLVFTGEGISRMDEFEEGYVVVKENRYGIMNFQFEWVIPCQYLFLQPKYLEYYVDCDKAKFQYPREGSQYCLEYFFQQLYDVQNELGMGIVNEQNEVVIPGRYIGVEMVSGSYYNQKSPRFFIAYDKIYDHATGTKHFYTIEGKPINLNKQDTLLRYCLATDSSQTNYHCFALYKSRIGKKDQYKMVNMLTLEQSAYYDDISVFYDRILVRKGTLWSVLTDQLDIAWSGKLPFASWQRINLEDYRVLSEQSGGTQYSHFDNPEVLDHRSPHFWIFDNTEQLAEKDILGIQDYEQNVSIPPIYEKIFHYELNGASYFWAYGLAVLPTEGKLSRQVKAKVGKIDVYNNRFELLNTIEQRDFVNPSRKPIYIADANQALFLVDDHEQGKKIYDLSGKSLLQDSFSKAIFQWNTNFFTLEDKTGSWGMYDFDGKQLLPHTYDNINCTKFYTVATKYDMTTVFDSTLQVVADSMKYWPTVHKTTSLFNFTLSSNSSLAYLEKNNQVYLLNDYKLVPVNDQTVNIMGNYLVLSKELIVDRNGKRIAITDEMNLFDSQTYPYCLEYIPIKTQPAIQDPSSVYTGWKSQNDNNNAQTIRHRKANGITQNDHSGINIPRNVRVVKFVNPHYASFTTSDPHKTQVRYKANDLENYAIINDVFHKLYFTELVPKENWEQLDALLLVEINKGQYFGQNCVNIQEKLDWLKQHFLLTETGISFFYIVDERDDGYFSVELPYVLLKDVLIPEAFIKLTAD